MNKYQRGLHAGLSFVSLILIALFAIWWFNPSHVAHQFTGYYRILDLVLFVALTYIIWHPIIMEVLTWAIASHIRTRPTPQPERAKKVAFVTTFVPGSETLELLEKTLPAMVRVNYVHDTWLLDEGDDPDVKALCRRLGVYHFSRHGFAPYNGAEGRYARKTKGGNHNAWYDAYGKYYDFVAQMDTDFTPSKHFLTSTLGYFRDPKVAFVGTPQVYGNEHESIIARGAAQQTFSFYGTLLRGMDGMDTAMLIGANHVVRVAALKEVNYYSPHITEDLLTGMKLHAAGWKSVYVPKVLAIGEGPVAWKAYFDQQRRWAYGCMSILFGHSGKLFRKMGLRRSIYYFFIQQHYFNGLATGISVGLLGLFFIAGIQTANIDLASFIIGYIPVLIAIMIMQFWLQTFNVRPRHESGMMFAGMFINLAAWPIFMMAFFNLFKRKKLVYKVTPKGTKARKRRDNIQKLFMPHYAIALIAAMSLAIGLQDNSPNAMMLAWAFVATVTAMLVPISIPLALSWKWTKRGAVALLAFLRGPIGPVPIRLSNRFVSGK